ncbi:MAG: hypothetical protein RIS35_986 [Pseudomonadota bacterium]
MLFTLLILAYLYLAFFVGIFGRRTRLGFLRSAALAVAVTPPVAATILFLCFPARKDRSDTDPTRSV